MCQCKAHSLIEDTGETIVEVEWDAIPDARGYKNNTVSNNNKRLLPSKWRKDEEGTWRMDVEIDIESDIDDGCDQETGVVDDEIEREVE